MNNDQRSLLVFSFYSFLIYKQKINHSCMNLSVNLGINFFNNLKDKSFFTK
uniref:Uncharacterized protein n=1 Tax=Brugia timori TaxID=42155 RepID=A0A0R3R2F0_9BILA